MFDDTVRVFVRLLTALYARVSSAYLSDLSAADKKEATNDFQRLATELLSSRNILSFLRLCLSELSEFCPIRPFGYRVDVRRVMMFRAFLAKVAEISSLAVMIMAGATGLSAWILLVDTGNLSGQTQFVIGFALAYHGAIVVSGVVCWLFWKSVASVLETYGLL